ncbi:MAG TPA: chromate efflux transporter [Anaerolineaceae bacterium]
MQPPSEQLTYKARLLEVAGLFLKLGLTAFGGPAAGIAMMHNEVVTRRKWIDEQRFLELFGAANLIPGPTSTEMVIYLGIQRAGWIGLPLGGICFIMPAMLMSLALAWAYVEFGTTPVAAGLFYGLKPVVIAIIAQALWGLGRKAVKNLLAGAAGLAAVVLYLLGVNVLAILLAGGLVIMAAKNIRRLPKIKAVGLFLPLTTGLAFSSAAVPFSLALLFLTFLKIGAVLYGSGYVLLAFLRADLVNNLGWLTDRQLIDAIAIGQITPGPLFTSATFIGYLVGGVPGALLATLGIFLPSFFFVAVSSPLLPRIRSSAWASAFLDGVTVASLGLMAGVTLQLGIAAFVDPLTIIVALVCLFLLVRLRINSTWLIAGGALIGLAHTLIG